MRTFKEFLQATESPAPETPPAPAPAAAEAEEWKASKPQIMDYWQKLRPEVPLQVKPISYVHKGSTYGEDGLRVTGSPQFIGSVLARLKDMLTYETPTTKLGVTYRQTKSPSQAQLGQAKTSYVFYASVRERGDGPGGPA